MKFFKKRILGKKFKDSYDFRIINKKKEIRTVNYTGVLIKKQGKIIGVQVMLRDVTDSRRLMGQIEQSKKHHLQVIDAIQDAICVVDKDCKIQSCNKAFAEKVEIPITKVKGRACQKVLPLFEKKLFEKHCTRKYCDNVCQMRSVFRTGKKIKHIEDNLDSSNSMRFIRLVNFLILIKMVESTEWLLLFVILRNE